MNTPATRRRRLVVLTASLFATPSLLLHAQDVTAGNLAVQQQAYFGTIYTDAEASNIAEGLRIDASQATAEVYRTSITPGYYQDNWVTVEDWGTVETGHWENTTALQFMGYDTIPATFDAEGNVITPETYEPRYDWVVTGTYWVVDSSAWGVTGTHQENQAVWIPEQTNSWTEVTNGGTPRVRFNATRSDTNFVFRVPSPAGADGMKDLLVLWEGGLTLPNADPQRTSVLTSGSLMQAFNQADGEHSQQIGSVLRAESIAHSSNVQRVDNGVALYESSLNEARAEFVRLTRTETTDGVSTVAQTQIAAKSASFAGVVEIAGDAKVQGVLRVKPAGDLVMGAFTNGPQP